MNLLLDKDSLRFWVYVDCIGFNLFKNVLSMRFDG